MGDFYLPWASGNNLAKSAIVKCNELSTFTIVHIDGQRSLPDGNTRLLLLNVVASSPLILASPDTLMLLIRANLSKACHVCEFVIIKDSDFAY